MRRQEEEEMETEMECGRVGWSTSNERYLQSLKKSWCSNNPWTARYIYGLMFLLANLWAWMVRDYGQPVLSDLERLEGCRGARFCLGTEGVLRVSLGCFTFYFIMFLSTVGTSKLHHPRDSWHSDWWIAKIFLWISFMGFPFFVPPAVIDIYGKIAQFGAGVFLLIQLISIISFITWLNDCLTSEKYTSKCQAHIHITSTASYVASLSGIILMYIWYVPKLSCALNIFFITWTLLLLQLMTCASLHPRVNGGFFTPGLMGLYVVFICWTALRSEPATEVCDSKVEAATNEDWLTIISFIIALLAMVIATFATGLDSKTFQFRTEVAQGEDDVPYGYGFFHFVFAMGAMYFAMLLIGWKEHHTMRKWTIDVGWTSTWVKIVNEWLAACIYSYRAAQIWEKKLLYQQIQGDIQVQQQPASGYCRVYLSLYERVQGVTTFMDFIIIIRALSQQRWVQPQYPSLGSIKGLRSKRSSRKCSKKVDNTAY